MILAIIVGHMSKILLVEDSLLMQNIVSQTFQDSSPLLVASTIKEAKAALEAHVISLILLDIQLPDGDGFNFCEDIKKDSKLKEIPIIFLTGKNEASSVIQGFKLGAEDYVAKPFDPGELKARVEARIARIANQKATAGQLRVGDIRIQLHSQSAVKVDDTREEALDLSPIEFKLLVFFGQNPRKILSRAELLEQVWGGDIHVLDRTIDTHVSRLRKKLDNCSLTVRTVHGQGYTLQEKNK